MNLKEDKKLLLVVDDDQGMRDLLQFVLTNQGYQVKAVANGAEALSALRDSSLQSQLPHLIILDLMMPVKDGFKFREEQLKDESLKSVPVIVLSADNQYVSEKENLKAYEFLNKPIEMDDLLYIVGTYFTLNQKSVIS